MLGVEEIVTIDVSDYEKAGVVLDLMLPLPEKYEGIADFIIGGSTLDNVFDPAMYLMNINRLLRPGGRLFEIDCAVNGFGFVAYLIFTAAWFLDYFVVNKFDDCKVYLVEIPGFWYLYGFGVNPNNLIDGSWIENFPNRPGCQLWIAVIAEKGANSTYSARPNQAQYRAKEEWQPYFESLKHMAANPRRWVRGSTPTPGEIAHTPPHGPQIGYEFLGTLFTG
jgi:SAM-dependent methyltransferase